DAPRAHRIDDVPGIECGDHEQGEQGDQTVDHQDDRVVAVGEACQTCRPRLSAQCDQAPQPSEEESAVPPEAVAGQIAVVASHQLCRDRRHHEGEEDEPLGVLAVHGLSTSPQESGGEPCHPRGRLLRCRSLRSRRRRFPLHERLCHGIYSPRVERCWESVCAWLCPYPTSRMPYQSWVTSAFHIVYMYAGISSTRSELCECARTPWACSSSASPSMLEESSGVSAGTAPMDE